MEEVKIKASPKQVSRLRNGHKVRVSKPDVEGEGFNLLVAPETYNQITRSFAKGKGTTLQLSPQELVASQGVSGRGIFSDLSRKAKPVLKDIQSGAKDAMKEIKKSAPAIKEGAKSVIEGIKKSIPEIKSTAQDFIGSFSAKKKKKGGNLFGALRKVMKNPVVKGIEKAGIKAIASQAKAKGYSPDLVNLGQSLATQAVGNGLYAGGRGLMAGGAVKDRRHNIPSIVSPTGYLGGRDQLLSYTSNPAMASQPYGANFQFHTQLPPALQRL